jgi:hypothetical protein
MVVIVITFSFLQCFAFEIAQWSCHFAVNTRPDIAIFSAEQEGPDVADDI